MEVKEIIDAMGVKEVAHRLGVTTACVRNWRRNNRAPRWWIPYLETMYEDWIEETRKIEAVKSYHESRWSEALSSKIQQWLGKGKSTNPVKE